MERYPQLGVHSGGVHSEASTVRGVHSGEVSIVKRYPQLSVHSGGVHSGEVSIVRCSQWRGVHSGEVSTVRCP